MMVMASPCSALDDFSDLVDLDDGFRAMLPLHDRVPRKARMPSIYFAWHRRQPALARTLPSVLRLSWRAPSVVM
jgi:hypothetical protein